MNAHGLALNDEASSWDEPDERHSQVQLIAHRVPRTPWVKHPSTLLEQTLEENSMNGTVYVVEDVTFEPEAAHEGGFEALELTLAPMDGEVISSRRARCRISEIPLRKRRVR